MNTKERIMRILFEWRYLLAICLIGVIPPLVWFRQGLIIAGGDNFFYLDPSSNFLDYAYTWLAKVNAGAPNLAIMLTFPFMFFWVVLKAIGLSLVNIERVWAILLFVLPGVSIYHLVTNLNPKENNEIAGFIAALLYMFNMFVTVDVLSPTVRPVQAFLPILLYFWIMGLGCDFSLRYPVMISLTSLLYASTAGNLATNAPIFISFGVYLLYYVLSHKNLVHAIKFSIATGLLYALVNAWWITTSFVFMTQASSSIHAAVKTVDFTGRTHLHETFRFMGFWAFREKYSSTTALIPFAHLYYEPLLLILTFSIPLLAFMAPIVRPKDKTVLFFTILAFVGLFLVKGANAPAGFIYTFLFRNVPGFWIFREPFSKFTLINTLSFSVLLGFSVEGFYTKMQAKVKRTGLSAPHAFLLLVIFTIFLASHPLITGKTVQDYSWYNETKFSLYAHVPDYWYAAGRWLETTDKDARILLFPKAGYGHCYNWTSGMCTGSPAAQVLLPNPILRHERIISNKEVIINSLYDKDDDFIHLLGIFNVRYILQQNDLDWERAAAMSPGQIKTNLTQQKGIEFVRTTGKLDFYEVTDEIYYPKVYVPRGIKYIERDLTESDLTKLGSDRDAPSARFISTDNQEDKNRFLINAISGYEKPEKQANTPEKVASESDNTHLIEFKKINPTKYQINVREANTPFILVFSESFHPGWKAYIESVPIEIGDFVRELNKFNLKESKYNIRVTPADIGYLFKSPIAESRHFMVNGYANAWYVDPGEVEKEEFTLTLYFKPQSYFYIGLIISGLTIVGCIGFLFYLSKKSNT